MLISNNSDLRYSHAEKTGRSLPSDSPINPWCYKLRVDFLLRISEVTHHGRTAHLRSFFTENNTRMIMKVPKAHPRKIRQQFVKKAYDCIHGYHTDRHGQLKKVTYRRFLALRP